MASAPTDQEAAKLQRQSREAERKKRLTQKKHGKEFVNNGQGVIPEAVWQNLPGKKEGSQDG